MCFDVRRKRAERVFRYNSLCRPIGRCPLATRPNGIADLLSLLFYHTFDLSLRGNNMQDYREQSESEQGGINPTLSSSDTIDALAVGIRCYDY